MFAKRGENFVFPPSYHKWRMSMHEILLVEDNEGIVMGLEYLRMERSLKP